MVEWYRPTLSSVAPDVVVPSALSNSKVFWSNVVSTSENGSLVSLVSAM